MHVLHRLDPCTRVHSVLAVMTNTTWKSKKMRLIYFVLLTTVKAVKAETRLWENIHNNNDWTPITRDKVYNRLDENLFSKINDKETVEQNTNELMYIQRVFADLESARKFTQPGYIKFEDNLLSSRTLPNFLPDSEVDGDRMNVVEMNAIHNRRAKAISNNGIDVVNIITKPDKLVIQNDSSNETEQVTVKHGNQYQVTENQLQKEDLEKINNNNNKLLVDEPSNNHYDIVNRTVKDDTDSNSNEFTNKFLNILSNYNIRVNDVLSNYELSRHSSRNPSTREYIMVPIPIRLANRFNSLNHATFDPLLAVFLSNFGYYLSGHYGINNKYHNLYGYLASNNIHNNNPFGSYKIFADTDSSN